jgi:hypothetical protein
MSRRSLLLASTICAAVASLAVDQASARGGGQFGHAPSVGGPVAGAGALARTPIQTARPASIQAVHPVSGGNVAAGTRIAHPQEVSQTSEMRFVHPQSAPQAAASSGFIAGHHPVDGGTIARIANVPTGPSMAAIIAAHLVAEKNPATQSTGVPNVAGPTGTVFTQGQQQSASTPSIPGLGNNPIDGTSGGTSGGPIGGISRLNLPGGQNGQTQGQRSILGMDSLTGGASKLNTPGQNDNQDGVISVQQAIAKLVGKDNDLSNQATRGGINGLNIPTQSSPGQNVADNTDNGKTSSNNSNSVVQFGTPVSAPSARNGERAAQSSVGTGTVSEVKSDGTIDAIWTDGKNTTTMMTVGPIEIKRGPSRGGGKNTPSDDGSSSVSAGTPLDARSSFARTNQGGGTGNNSEATGGQRGGLAAGSAYATRNHGDGGGNDAGDNNRISKDGTLATGGALARKDQGDGGGSDSRGGGGATSVITSASKPVNPGGGHNQMSATAARTQ